MKKNVILIICLLYAAVLKSQVPFQSRPTAFTIDHKEFEISLLSPTRYGVGKKTEVFSTVFLDWKLPNAGLKHLWWKKPAKKDRGFFKSRDIWFGSVHNLDYPNMFFKSVQKHKPDYIADSCIVPNVITMRNELRMSLYLRKATSCDGPDFLFTLRAGIKNSFKIKKDVTMPPVTRNPLWYRETAVCLDTIVWFVGADLDFHLTDNLNMLVDLDFYSVDWNVKDHSLESKIFVYGYAGMHRRLMISGGIKLIAGSVYSENKYQILPMADVSYFWRLKKKREKGLFGEMM